MVNREELWKEFYKSESWQSWCVTPLSYKDMLLAVTFGDAEVKEHSDEWGPDLFFKWTKPAEERSHEYHAHKAKGCCDGELPTPR